MATPRDFKSLRARLSSVGDKEREPLYGLFLATFSPTSAEIAGHSGYDFVVIDMQHGHGDIPNALSCLHALSAAQTPAILRLPESSAVWAKKALDIGPQGLIFPGVNDPDSARNAVSYCAHPPKGVRGAGHPAVRASSYGLDHNYLSKCEDGVDCVMIGPLSLGLSPSKLRMAGAALLELKGEKGQGKGPYLAGFPTHQNHQEGALELKRRGYHMVCGALDVTLFRDAALANISSFKSPTSMN